MSFKTNLRGVVFLDFKICLADKKKVKPNEQQKTAKKYCLYNKKKAHLNLKHFVQANLNLKNHISGYFNKNPPYLNQYFLPNDSQIRTYKKVNH